MIIHRRGERSGYCTVSVHSDCHQNEWYILYFSIKYNKNRIIGKKSNSIDQMEDDFIFTEENHENHQKPWQDVKNIHQHVIGGRKGEGLQELVMTRMWDKTCCDPQNYDDNIYSEPHIFMVINTVTLIIMMMIHMVTFVFFIIINNVTHVFMMIINVVIS